MIFIKLQNKFNDRLIDFFILCIYIIIYEILFHIKFDEKNPRKAEFLNLTLHFQTTILIKKKYAFYTLAALEHFFLKYFYDIKKKLYHDFYKALK